MIPRLLFLAWLGCALVATLPPGWPRPDPVLLVLIPVALRGGAPAGAVFGLAGGLGLGLFSPGTAAVPSLVYGAAGAVLGWIAAGQPGSRTLFCLAMAAAGSVLVALGMAAAGRVGLGPEIPVLQRWLPGALCANLLFALPAMGLVGRGAGLRGDRA